MRAELELAIKEAADDALGIYPKSFRGKDRTEWQEGWNAAVIKLSQNESKITDWITKLNNPIVEQLLIDEAIILYLTNDDIEIHMNCNDVFMWACSDMEEVTFDELENFAEMSKTPWGAIKWVCIKRNEKPQYPMIWDMSQDGEWDDVMENLPDNAYNEHVGWAQTPTKPWRSK